MWNLKKKKKRVVLYFAYSPSFLKTKMRTKCHLDLWMLSPCDFRQGHVYTHTQSYYASEVNVIFPLVTFGQRELQQSPEFFLILRDMVAYGTFVLEYVNK